jgi:hypothetical protein
MPVNQKSSANWFEILMFAALAVMVIWFCDEIVFARKIPFFRDLVTYFYPIKFSVAEAFQAGSLPLWDRHMASGFPIMAGLQSAVFYPLTLGFYLLPFSAAIQFTFVIHYLIAASGGYCLFRSWNYPIQIALIGAVLLTFGGTTVSLTNLLNHFQSAVWLPWIVLFWERAVTTRRWSDIAIFSCVSACQLLAGSPEIFALTLGLLVLDTIRLEREQRIRSFLAALAVLMGSIGMIVGLGMVQLLPTAELISLSRRDQPIPASEALGWSLRPASLLGLLLPTLEADPSLSVGIRMLFAQSVPFLLSHYMGVITVFGLCCWFRAAHLKERIFLLVIIGCSLLLAFGSFTPIYPFLYEWVPAFRVMRFPEKYFYLTFALLLFAVVRGLRQMTQEERSNSPWVISSVILAAWLLVYITFRIHPQFLADLLQPPPPPPQIAPSANPKTIAAILVILEKQVAIAFVLAGLLCLNRFGAVRDSLWHALLVLTVFFDLSSANKPLHFLREATLIENAPRIIDKRSRDPSRLFYYPPGQNLHPSYVRVSGSPDHAKATEIAINNLLPNAGMLHGFEYFQDIDALGRRSYTDFLHFINALPNERRGQLLAAANVEHVVSFHELNVRGLELVQEFPEHYSRLYRIAEAVPRIYIATQAIHDPDPKRTLDRISSEGFDLRRQVVLDAPVQLEPTGVFEGHTAVEEYRNHRVEITAELNRAGILVLTDAYHPGWKVRVDGREQKVLRANYLFRGVELSAGKHKVEFSYEPESFRIGLIVSLGTAGILVAVPLLGWFRRRAVGASASAEIAEQPLTLRSD